MAMLTQGSQLYYMDPANHAVLEVGCLQNMDGIDTSMDQIEVTCLARRFREYMSGLATPGTATFEINFDTTEVSHTRMHELKVAGTQLEWAFGFSNGSAAPSAVQNSAGDYVFNPPSSRSWIVFAGNLTSYPFSVQQNSVVKSNVEIQISGEPTIIVAHT